MRLSLLSLFLLITFAATLLWGIGQSRELARLHSQYSRMVPTVEPQQISCIGLNAPSDSAVIVVGDQAKGRLLLLKCNDDNSRREILQEMTLVPGDNILWLERITTLGPAVKYGFVCRGESHLISGPLQGGSSGDLSFTITGKGTETLMEAIEFHLPDSNDHYLVVLESFDTTPKNPSSP